MNGKRMRSKRIKKDDLENKDKPTACTHFAPHSAVQHFSSDNQTQVKRGGGRAKRGSAKWSHLTFFLEDFCNEKYLPVSLCLRKHNFISCHILETDIPLQIYL